MELTTEGEKERNAHCEHFYKYSPDSSGESEGSTAMPCICFHVSTNKLRTEILREKSGKLDNLLKS